MGCPSRAWRAERKTVSRRMDVMEPPFIRLEPDREDSSRGIKHQVAMATVVMATVVMATDL